MKLKSLVLRASFIVGVFLPYGRLHISDSYLGALKDDITKAV